MVEFGCVGAEIKWDTVWFLAAQAIRILHRKIRLTQLWVKLSWVVAIVVLLVGVTYTIQDLKTLEK